MKLHAPIGAEILSAIDFPYPVVPIVRHHHENWDGTGYPDRIAGADIPIGARILSVVDCFDALTSDRPYRKRMTDEEALAILRERRGTMYDPVVVDAFSANYKRIMPADEAVAHPAARAVGGARDATPAPAGEAQETDGACGSENSAINEVLTISSLARAVSGNASLSDVGALAWMTLRNVVPANAMALFVEDQRQDLMTVAHAAGAHASMLRQLKKARGGGIAGWVAVNRRGVLNAEASLDLGLSAASLDPPLRSSLTVPLSNDGRVVGVLSCYSATARGFTEDHQRLLELVAASLASAMAAVTNAEGAAPQLSANASRRVSGSTVLSIVR